jgi:hypothetical protein
MKVVNVREFQCRTPYKSEKIENCDTPYKREGREYHLKEKSIVHNEPM